MNLRKRIITLFASLALILGIAAVTTQPAEALTNDWTDVYNSDYSVACILVKVYDDPSVGYFQRQVCPGGHTGTIWNGDDNIRIDVEYESSCLFCDVDSYKKGEIGVGWGPCYNGENESANPPDSYNNGGIRIRNYKGSIGDANGCS